jgi:hypothetical protein
MKMALDCWLLTRASAGIPRRLHEPCREVRAPRWMRCGAGTDASESGCCGLGCRVSTADHVPKYHAAAGRQQCGSLMKQSRDGTGEAWPLFFTDGCTTRSDSDGNALFWRHVSMRRSQSRPVAASRRQSQPCQLHHAMDASLWLAGHDSHGSHDAQHSQRPSAPAAVCFLATTLQDSACLVGIACLGAPSLVRSALGQSLRAGEGGVQPDTPTPVNCRPGQCETLGNQNPPHHRCSGHQARRASGSNN